MEKNLCTSKEFVYSDSGIPERVTFQNSVHLPVQVYHSRMSHLAAMYILCYHSTHAIHILCYEIQKSADRASFVTLN